MKRKVKANVLFLIIMLSAASLLGCRTVPKTTPTPIITSPAITSPAITSPLPVLPTSTLLASPTASPDVMTTASIVDNAGAFEKAISKTGTWIICLLNDLTINKDLTLDGDFKNGKKDQAGKDIIQRKIALYTQDQNRKVTKRFTLTAPKMTIKSLNASIQHGTFKGDLYVSAKNFELVDSTVEGNLYFTSSDAQSSFKMDTTSKVTGKRELKK
jgi:hypothetical protein